MRKHYHTGAKWESKVAYSRGVRVDNIVEIAGTTAVDGDGKVMGVGDAFTQTNYILKLIENSLKELGAELRHVVRTRMFVTDISLWQEVGRAHKEMFDGIDPVATMIEISKLIDPEMLIEIEATAIIPREEIEE